MAKPGAYSPKFVKGDDWSFQAAFADDAGDPLDLTGYTFLAQARVTHESASPAFTFTVDNSQAAAGILTLTAAAAVTATLSRPFYVWDLQWTDTAGDVRTVLAGTVTVVAEVSRP